LPVGEGQAGGGVYLDGTGAGLEDGEELLAAGFGSGREGWSASTAAGAASGAEVSASRLSASVARSAVSLSSWVSSGYRVLLPMLPSVRWIPTRAHTRVGTHTAPR
jgi:hypothetical protein